jgi:uncharacterized protein YcaQ
VYDLAERVAPQLASLKQAQALLPAAQRQPAVAHASARDCAPDSAIAAADGAPGIDQVRNRFLEKSVAALGITQARWVHDYYRSKPRLKDQDLDALVEQGALMRVRVEGWSAPAYVHASQAALLKQATANKLQATHTALLSPFDPIVWDRERALAMFDFDYRLECYTPEAKRVHGYFVLPILCRGELIGSRSRPCMRRLARRGPMHRSPMWRRPFNAAPTGTPRPR